MCVRAGLLNRCQRSEHNDTGDRCIVELLLALCPFSTNIVILFVFFFVNFLVILESMGSHLLLHGFCWTGLMVYNQRNIGLIDACVRKVKTR